MKKHFYHVVFVLCLTFVLALPLHAAAAEFNYTADVEKVVLDNGLTILLKENPAYDIIAMSVLTKGGSVRDPEGLEGLTFLTVRNLSRAPLIVPRGYRRRTRISRVQLQATASYDYSAVLLQAVPAAFEEALAVLLDMIENSTFPVEEFERERSLGFAALQSLYDDPSNALILEFLSFFYGEHPYRYSPYGSPEGLMAIQPIMPRAGIVTCSNLIRLWFLLWEVLIKKNSSLSCESPLDAGRTPSLVHQNLDQKQSSYILLKIGRWSLTFLPKQRS